MKIAKGIASVLKTIGLVVMAIAIVMSIYCLLYTSPSPRDS